MLEKQRTSVLLEAGCDEAGRGCLAGPVVAAAVILGDDFDHSELNDSKKLSAKKREELRLHIETNALGFSVAFIYPELIEKINILNASVLAMHRALENLQPVPEQISVDGNRFKPYKKTPFETVVKGDGKFANIAAAGILAKTHRDEYMQNIHLEFEHYGWKKNKGYPTAEHQAAILEHGICKYHRKTFRVKGRQMQLIFEN